MKKFAIAILLSAGTFMSVPAHATDGAFIGAVDGALAGSYIGGAHGAVAGAIIGAAIGSSVDDGYYDRRGGWVRYERQARYQPAPVYYSTPSYRPYYESEQVVYVQPPVYESYSDIYAGYPYGAPYYSVRYASPRYGHYAPRHGHYVPRHGHYDYRHRY